MKLSIHPQLRGKPDAHKRADNSTYYTVNGQYVNQGYGWVNVECTWDEAFELVTVDGYATSSELSSDNRCDEHYVSRQLIMVDIDHGMTIQDLFQDPFYNEYGAGFYVTRRHTPEAHRFRIMFVCEQPITDTVQMRQLIRGLLTLYNTGDVSCKDASRVYYGQPDCEIRENLGRVLTQEAIDTLVSYIREQDELERQRRQHMAEQILKHTTADQQFVEALLQRIAARTGSLRGDYNQWRTIAWATCSAVGTHMAEALMRQYWRDKTDIEITTLRAWRATANGPGIGTLVKLSGISKSDRELLELGIKIRNLQ